MYIIDTNIFLRVLISDEKNIHEDCVALLRAVKENKIQAATTSLILAEIVWTLSSYYKFSRKRVIEALSGIQNLRGLIFVDKYDHKQALNFFKGSKAKYIDCLIASICGIKNGSLIIISFDKDFDKLAIVRKEPKEILSSL